MNKFWMIANFSVSLFFGLWSISLNISIYPMIPNLLVGIYCAYKVYSDNPK